MKAPANHSSSLADFWDDGPSSDSSSDRKDNNYSSKNNNNSSSSSSNVPDILNWISNVQIKRRKFRRRFRCSNLLAEAVLSSTLRQARHELSVKQEEKRRKAQEFSYQLNIIKYSPQQEEDSNNNSQNCENNYCSNNDQNNYSNNNQSQQKINMDNNNNCRKDEHVQACISSLDNFFSELKSIKV